MHTRMHLTEFDSVLTRHIGDGEHHARVFTLNHPITVHGFLQSSRVSNPIVPISQSNLSILQVTLRKKTETATHPPRPHFPQSVKAHLFLGFLMKRSAHKTEKFFLMPTGRTKSSISHMETCRNSLPSFLPFHCLRYDRT